MVLPQAWDTRQLKGTRLDFSGNAAQGKLIFTPTAPRVKEKGTDAIIFAKPIEVPLQPDGTFLVTLPVSVGDTDITPYFQYTVLEQLKGTADHTYTIEVDLALPAGAPFDIADLTPTGAVPFGTTALTKERADLLYQPKGTDGSGGAPAGSWNELMQLPDYPGVFPPQIGTSGTEAVAGNDPRLDNPRTPLDLSVTNAKVAADAGINLDKTVDSATRRTLTAAEKTTVGNLKPIATSGSASDITTGMLPTSVLPPLSITRIDMVASQTAMLALDAQPGDVAVRTEFDPDQWYMLAASPASTLANWKQITAAGAVTMVAGKTGSVSLVQADITGLVDRLVAIETALTARLLALDSIRVIPHGSDVNYPRPANIGAAYWVGSVKPLAFVDGVDYLNAPDTLA